MVCVLISPNFHDVEGYVAMLKSIFGDIIIIKDSCCEAFVPDDIIRSTAHHYRCSFDDVVGNCRTKVFVEARQMTMYLLMDVLGMSYSSIGRTIGKDHSTVMHGIRKIEDKLESPFSGNAMQQQIYDAKSTLNLYKKIKNVQAEAAI